MTNNFQFSNIGVVCEGQTEVDFIKKLNRKYFNLKFISLKPVNIIKNNVNNSNLKGNISIDRVVHYLIRSNYNILTTFIDFYGMKDKGTKNVDELEQQLKTDFKRSDRNDKIFIPYIQLHETEALWFSDINAIIQAINANEKQKTELNKINIQYPNPENINNSSETAPSKRLEKILNNNYNKLIYGNLISDKIPIEIFRQKCPRFNNWINNIETVCEKLNNK